MAADADHDLLFGLLALQNGLIHQGQLVAAFQAWTLDKARANGDGPGDHARSSATFLTGFAGLNANGSVGEMLRLNLDTPATPAAQQKPLGVIDGDVAGFPNGRRPGDDVVDIALRVVMGVLLTTEQAPAGQLPFTDGAFIDASFFDDTTFMGAVNPDGSDPWWAGWTVEGSL